MKEIFRLTIKEVMSKRLLQLMLLLTIVYLGLYAYGQYMVISNEDIFPPMGNNAQWFMQQFGYQFLSLGWYIASFIVGAVAVVIGSSSISREIESGTILGLASKPLSRKAIIGGKFVAYTFLSMAYAGVLALAVMLINTHFFTTPLQPAAVIKGIGIFMILPVTLLAPAILCSTLLSSLASGVTMFFVFCVGIIGGFLEQIGALINNEGLIEIGIVTSLITPGDAVYRLAISQAGGPIGAGVINAFGPFGSASTPSTWMLVYSLFYIVLMLVLAVRVFRKLDF